MKQIIIKEDGAYLNLDDMGREVKLECIVVKDKQSGDYTLVFDDEDVDNQVEDVDPLRAYDMSKANMRRLAVKHGLISQAEANRIGRVK